MVKQTAQKRPGIILLCTACCLGATICILIHLVALLLRAINTCDSLVNIETQVSASIALRGLQESQLQSQQYQQKQQQQEYEQPPERQQRIDDVERTGQEPVAQRAELPPPQQPPSKLPRSPETNYLSISNGLLVTQHSGCLMEYEATIKQATGIQFERYDFESLCPRCSVQGMSRETAERAEALRSTANICNNYSIIWLTDHLPHGRHFMQAKIAGRCNAVLVLAITNRFDFGMTQDQEYARLFSALVREKTVYLAPNNNFEREYLSWKGIILPPTRTLLVQPYGRGYFAGASDSTTSKATTLSLGNSALEKREDEEDVVIDYTKLACIYNTSASADFAYRKLQRRVRGQSVERLPSQSFGGIQRLRQCIFVIYIPYQFSTMKVYEGISHGIVTAVPTPRLLQETIYSGTSEIQDEYANRQMRNIIGLYPDGRWHEFFDVYQKDNKDLFWQFDQWQDLAAIIDSPTRMPIADLKSKMRLRSKKHHTTVLWQMKSLFAEIDVHRAHDTLKQVNSVRDELLRAQGSLLQQQTQANTLLESDSRNLHQQNKLLVLTNKQISTDLEILLRQARVSNGGTVAVQKHQDRLVVVGAATVAVQESSSDATLRQFIQLFLNIFSLAVCFLQLYLLYCRLALLFNQTGVVPPPHRQNPVALNEPEESFEKGEYQEDANHASETKLFENEEDSMDSFIDIPSQLIINTNQPPPPPQLPPPPTEGSIGTRAETTHSV